MDSAWVRNLAVCTFGSFTTIVGMTMLVPYLPVYIRQLGLDDADAVITWSGVCFGATFLTSALCAPLWGMLGDRYGRKSMLVRASLGMSVAIGLTGAAQDVWQLLGLRLLTGVLGGFASGSMILVADRTPLSRRGFAIGILTSGVMAGNLAGPLLGGIVPTLTGPRAAFAWTGALIFVAFLAVVSFLPGGRPAGEPPAKDGAAESPTPETKVPAGSGVRARLVLLVGVAALITFASMSVEPFITVFMGQLPGGEPSAVWGGAALSATAAGTMVSGPLLGRLADALGHHRVLTVSLLMAALFAALQFIAHTAVVLVILRFALGLAVGGLTPAVTSAIRELVPANRVGRILGLTVSAQFAGQVIGPLFGAWVATGAGMREAFLASGAVLAVAAVVVMVALRGPSQPAASGASRVVRRG